MFWERSVIKQREMILPELVRISGGTEGSAVYLEISGSKHPSSRRHPQGLCMGQRLLRDRFTVYRERAVAAPPERLAFGVHLPIEDDGVLPGRQCVGALPLRALDAEQVHRKGGLAVLQIEAVAREPATLRHKHAVGPAFGHFDLCGDRVRAVEDRRRDSDSRRG